MALNARQQRFVDGVIAGKSATEAYRDAGYKAKGHAAETSASDLLRNPEVAAEIARRRAKVEKATGITAESVLRRLDEVANRCMQAVPVMEYSRLAEGMVQKMEYDDDGNLVGVYEFDSAGANRSLELIGKHLKLFTDVVKHEGLDDKAQQLAAARARAKAKP